MIYLNQFASLLGSAGLADSSFQVGSNVVFNFPFERWVASTLSRSSRLRGRCANLDRLPAPQQWQICANAPNLRFPAFYVVTYGVDRQGAETQSERKIGELLTFFFWKLWIGSTYFLVA